MLNSSNGTAAAVNTAKPSNAVQEIQFRLVQLHERFNMVADRMQRIASRAFGDQLAGENSKAQPREVPKGEIGSVMERIEDLTLLATEQEAVVSRLDGIV
jgi:hypothetical protein